MGALVSVTYLVFGYVGVLPSIPTLPVATAFTFDDSFDGNSLDLTRWVVEATNAVCCGVGIPATFNVSGGFLNVTVPGGSCGVCGTTDGSIFRPKIAPLVGDFEMIVSGEEIERLRRGNAAPLSGLDLSITSGMDRISVSIIGDVVNNSGAAGHQIYISSVASGVLDTLNIRQLVIGQYYSFEFRIRRTGAQSYVAYRLVNEINWTEFVVRQAMAPSLPLVPRISIVSEDGGGTLIDSSLKLRLSSVSIR